MACFETVKGLVNEGDEEGERGWKVCINVLYSSSLYPLP
jgi:hypothetical protein